MNKKQKCLIIASVLIFLFVTLNPTVFQTGKIIHIEGVLSPDIDRKYIYFTERPMYEYWACIAVPTIALFYFLKDKKSN
jgi:hypothetical protein